jgi:hypothetical protein
MKLTLEIELDDDEIKTIASAKQCEPDDAEEIRDYLNGWLKHGIEETGAD